MAAQDIYISPRQILSYLRTFEVKLPMVSHPWAYFAIVLFDAVGEHVSTRLCSDANDNAAEIYRQLGYNPVPFRCSA